MTHPSIRAGRRRTKVQFLDAREEQEEEYGTMVRRWRPAFTVMAEVQDMLPSRALDGGEPVANAARRSRIRMLRREGIEAGMRVAIGDDTMRIISGPVLIGRRRDGMELIVEAHSTQGQEP